MEDDYVSNVHVGLKKSVKCQLYGVFTLECSLCRGFVIKDSLGIRLDKMFCPSWRGVRFRGCPL